MKTLIKNIIIIGVLLTPIYLIGQFFPINKDSLNHATVKVRVVDESEQPLQNVLADYYSLSDDDSNPGLTDTKGMYSICMKHIYYSISGNFKKPGYYETRGQLWHWNKWGGVPPADTNFVVVLKRIIDPVPMKIIQRHNKTRVPEGAVFPRLDEPIGYDLEVGDWVFPDGKGKISDVFLTATGFYNKQTDSSIAVSVEFAGEHNGIQSFYYPKAKTSTPLRSELPPPVIAPESGYTKTLELYRHHKPNEYYAISSDDENRRWLFRIRTEVDENGKIVSANYGWTTEDIDLSASKGNLRMYLFYYYNPDPKSRSLEPKEIADRQNKN